MWRVCCAVAGVAVLATPVLAQDGTRDLNLGGAVMPDEKAKFTPDVPVVPHQPRADELPVEERPEPAKTAPEYVPFLWDRARSFHTKGWYLKACTDFDSIQQVGGDLNKEKDIVGRTYLACAQQAAAQHDAPNAQALLARSRSFIGEVPEMARVLGVISRQQAEAALSRGDIDQATRDFDLALKNEPDATDATKFSTDLAHMARNAYQRDDLNTAQRAVAASLKYFPDNRLAHDIARGIWLRQNMMFLVAAAFVALLAMIALYMLWRKARASRDEASLAAKAARISDAELDAEDAEPDA